MKKTAKTARGTSTREAAAGLIHPIIIYPFKQPGDYADLDGLYGLAARLAEQKKTYARPLTVMDRKTYYSNEGHGAFLDFRNNTVARHSDIIDAWCVDTCQMWYDGLGAAFERGGENDVYWLIPGDFNYGAASGQEVLSGLHDLPEIIQELNQDFCVGEVCFGHANSKRLIDTYGTFALLYTWFPTEAQEIRQFTERPRSEFFAVRHGFLREALMHRWYPYEQTLVMLLQAVFNKKRMSRFAVGNISDLPEGREPLAPALQQVERTERVLQSVWRERNQFRSDWPELYRELKTRSDEVRRAAFTILQNHLT
ncbi:MAG TPA: hypothetical protein VGO59_17425 [Verrucomicrobiae bacterium]|jgi:hypothetical protein